MKTTRAVTLKPTKHQVAALSPYWPRAAEWFIVGGPDGEAQAVAETYPGVRCLGCEPNPELFARQASASPPFPGQLLECALWGCDKDDLTLTYLAGRERAGSVCAPESRPDFTGADPHQLRAGTRTQRVRGRSIDSLAREYGPFRNCVLWLDIEYAELEALKGAERTLADTLLLNVETFAHLNLSAVVRLLRKYGLYLADVWNVGPTAGKDAQDYIFTRG